MVSGSRSASALTLTDDDTREMMLPFGFTFFNQQYDRVFVNSDGNLTFTESDTASTARRCRDS